MGRNIYKSRKPENDGREAHEAVGRGGDMTCAGVREGKITKPKAIVRDRRRYVDPQIMKYPRHP